MVPMKERKLRVYNSRRKHGVPCIELQGAWLAEMGFHPGDYITVSGEGNTLKITLSQRFSDEKPVKS